jgi:hypothetical protein
MALGTCVIIEIRAGLTDKGADSAKASRTVSKHCFWGQWERLVVISREVSFQQYGEATGDVVAPQPTSRILEG